MSQPPAHVVSAYGLDVDALRRLAGGQDRTWSDGAVVLKPVGFAAEHEWVCEVYAGWGHHESVRVPEPLPGPDGGWSYDGWAAHWFVPGRDASMRTDAALIRRAAEFFHAGVVDLPRPDFLDERDDGWTYGDSVAWDGAPVCGRPETRALIEAGVAAMRPVSAAAQVVHGDIGGNVVMADGHPPAIIDWPPYFRPAGWALAVAAVDGICWEGVPESLLDEWSDVPEWPQLCLRAHVYRVATRGRHEELGLFPDSSQEYVAACRPSLDAVLARL